MDNLEIMRTRLRSRRKNLNLSYRQIAEETGCSASTIHYFARQNSSPDAENRLKIGAWLGMSNTEIFGQRKITESSGGTLADIQKLISADETIPEEKRADFQAWFETTYETFKKR